MTSQQSFTSAVATVGSALKQHGFLRSGSKFTRTGREVVSLIQFQRSRDSTAACVTFVVNYGVAVLSIAHAEGIDPAKLSWTDCQWQARVQGKDGREAWWSVRDGDDPNALAGRLTHLVEEEVLPALEQVQHEADLVTLWTSGKSPGLGDARRLLCLARLLHSGSTRRSRANPSAVGGSTGEPVYAARFEKTERAGGPSAVG